MRKILNNIFRSLLDDEQGVSMDAFMCLHELAFHMEYEELNELLKKCDSTDGRFYLPEK